MKEPTDEIWEKGLQVANTADGTIAQENVPMDKEDVLTKLRELKPAITARYKVSEIGLFGSFVRGEQGSGSDIDLLAEFEATADLFDLIGLELYLEAFQHKVQWGSLLTIKGKIK